MDVSQYQQYQERAADYLNEMAEELGNTLGYDAFDINVHGPLVQLLVAQWMAQDARKRLGGEPYIAFLMDAPEARLTRKVSRLLLSEAKKIFEAAEMGVELNKQPVSKKNRVRNRYLEYRRLGDDQSRWRHFNESDDIVKRGRDMGHAALDNYVDHPPRHW